MERVRFRLRSIMITVAVVALFLGGVRMLENGRHWLPLAIYVALFLILAGLMLYRVSGQRRVWKALDQSQAMNDLGLQRQAESLEIQRRGLEVAEQSLALQRETHRLLEQLVSDRAGESDANHPPVG